MEPHELEATIQKQYDHAYRSELYVTSTVSVCVNKYHTKDQEPIEKSGFNGLNTRRIQDAFV